MDLGAGTEAILDMRMDTDGLLIGVGNTSSSIIECFAFKIATNGLLIWRSRLNNPGNSYFTRILEKNSGGNYLLFGQTDLAGTGNDTGCDALLMEINRNTGQLLWDRQYDLGSCEIVNDVFIENNQIYVCGRYNLVDGGQSRFRAALSLFDNAGNLQWSRHYVRDDDQDAVMYFNALVHENHSLVAFGWGNDAGTSLTATTLQLVKTDLTGAANWAKKYDIVGGNEERATKLFNLSDGYLLFGTFFSQTTSREICLLKTDKQGNFLWGKSYGGLGEDRLSDAILVSDTIYLIGSRQNGPMFDILIAKLDLNGEVDSQCGFAKNLDVTVSDYAAPLYFSHNLEELDITHNYATAALPPQMAETNVATEVICQKICDPPCDPVKLSQTFEFCPGGWATIGGNVYTQSGTVFDTIPGTGTDCDTIVTYMLILLPSPTRSETLSLCPGESVTIGGEVYFAPAMVVDTIWPTVGCDTLVTYTLVLLTNPVRSETIEFCPGDSVLIGGTIYTQPGTVLDTIPGTGTDCDTVMTYTLQFYQNSIVQIQCPVNITVEAASGANSAVVNYNLPTANTDCICGGATVELQQGQPSGSNFPLGATQVCYEVSDDCGGANACCFTVTIQAAPPDDACDVKITPCVKFEILGIFQNPAGRKTYRMRVTNTCANNLIYAAFQLPNGTTAYSPATNTTYTAPSGRQYEVRNPNYSPTYSIRFKAIGSGIANGESDIFEYTLSPQADPLYIYAIVRLYPKIFYETHLNVFDCEVQQIPGRPTGDVNDRQSVPNNTPEEFAVFPNPASDVLFVQLPPTWSAQRVQLRVTDAYGQQLFHQTTTAEANLLTLELPTDWPAGVYYLEAINEQGERQTGRFVRAER